MDDVTPPWVSKRSTIQPMDEYDRIVAAAPDLLHALDQLLVAAEKAFNAKTSGEERVSLIQLSAPICAANAAIKKARGQ